VYLGKIRFCRPSKSCFWIVGFNYKYTIKTPDKIKLSGVLFFSPDSNGNPLLKKDYFFLAPKERPTEAPFGG
ncbi:MAG: hypothetical protein ACK4M4_11290, partial [Flavobacterium sp.]